MAVVVWSVWWLGGLCCEGQSPAAGRIAQYPIGQHAIITNETQDKNQKCNWPKKKGRKDNDIHSLYKGRKENEWWISFVCSGTAERVSLYSRNSSSSSSSSLIRATHTHKSNQKEYSIDPHSPMNGVTRLCTSTQPRLGSSSSTAAASTCSSWWQPFVCYLMFCFLAPPWVSIHSSTTAAAAAVVYSDPYILVTSFPFPFCWDPFFLWLLFDMLLLLLYIAKEREFLPETGHCCNLYS